MSSEEGSRGGPARCYRRHGLVLEELQLALLEATAHVSTFVDALRALGLACMRREERSPAMQIVVPERAAPVSGATNVNGRPSNSIFSTPTFGAVIVLHHGRSADPPACGAGGYTSVTTPLRRHSAPAPDGPRRTTSVRLTTATSCARTQKAVILGHAAQLTCSLARPGVARRAPVRGCCNASAPRMLMCCSCQFSPRSRCDARMRSGAARPAPLMHRLQLRSLAGPPHLLSGAWPPRYIKDAAMPAGTALSIGTIMVSHPAAPLVLLAAAALAARASPTPTISGGLPGATSHAILDHAGKAAGKLYLGTATNNDQFNDTEYVSILRTQFGQITPANSMKWFDTEPERGVFNFTDGDGIRDMARRNGQLLRGHNCVWYMQLPDWVTAGDFDAPTLTDIVYNHCFTLVNHYAGEMCAINDDGTFRSDVFLDTLNSSYIPLAYHAARAADPHAKLYYNDYGIEGAILQAAHVPIDGVGVQSHLNLGQVPADMEDTLRSFTALGLDIRIPLPLNATALEQQRADFRSVRCVGVTVWDFTDKYSWIVGGFATPWDADLEKKPAFDGIVEGFGGH
ncbi:glycoside hydrolase superfamily [Gloeopeniophorella convolvens]|nr:glycoside hydrolase superfamily [Gloeopeniophorella convolvens]